MNGKSDDVPSSDGYDWVWSVDSFTTSQLRDLESVTHGLRLVSDQEAERANEMVFMIPFLPSCPHDGCAETGANVPQTIRSPSNERSSKQRFFLLIFFPFCSTIVCFKKFLLRFNTKSSLGVGWQ
jgi:hypothetical protein